MTLSTILIGILPSVFFGVPRHSTWPDGPLPERRARGTGIPGRAPFRRCRGGLLSFGDVGLVQECGSLTEQLSECVSAAFGKNAFDVCIREGLTRRVQQAVTLQVLITRIGKTR